MKFGVLFVFVFLLVGGLASAETNYIISNSENWEDVYSSMLYANLNGFGADFLVSAGHGELLWPGINNQSEIEVISSNDNSFVFNYDTRLNELGFKDAIETKVNNANLELVEKMPDIENFILVEEGCASNALAVVPYAIQNNAWVFIVTGENVAEVDSIMSKRDVNEVILYGYFGPEIRETFFKYDPAIINTGEKVEDNIEIVKAFLKIKPTNQVLFTSGDFIEKELMLGTFPILLLGKDNISEELTNYLKQSDLEVGVLIGNDLINAATDIRRDTGISVMVKYARSARQQEGLAAVTENLDLFPLPECSINVDKADSTFSSCKSLYWIDNEDKSCGQKEFCGAFMYYGLQTFESKEKCLAAVSGDSCLTDKDCWDSHDQNCYFMCQENKCVGFVTVKALPPYPYCSCGSVSCDWNNNLSGCASQCENIENNQNCACTMDAKICPDGSAVGRVCPDCRFAECTQVKTFNLSNGREAEIKIMPETASEKAIERLGELNFTIELKEVGKNKVGYELTTEKEGKMFGLFKVRGNVSVEVDAETGDVLKVNKPWWAFMASGI